MSGKFVVNLIFVDHHPMLAVPRGEENLQGGEGRKSYRVRRTSLCAFVTEKRSTCRVTRQLSSDIWVYSAMIPSPPKQPKQEPPAEKKVPGSTQHSGSRFPMCLKTAAPHTGRQVGCTGRPSGCQTHSGATRWSHRCGGPAASLQGHWIGRSLSAVP